MVTHKGRPASARHPLASPLTQVLGHVLAHSAWRDSDAELQQEFVRDPLFTPREILAGHTTDERLQVRRDGGSSRLRFPMPEEPEPLPMVTIPKSVSNETVYQTKVYHRC
jgi:hypothetical protein